MKKLLLGALMLAAFGGNAQTKKVILEDFTGTWCGWCPEGTVLLEDLKKNKYTTSLITIATHAAGGDPLIVADGTAIVSMLKQSSYPGGAVDRTLFAGQPKVPVSRSLWDSFIGQRAATTAIVSVSFANKKYNATTQEYEADVNIEFTAAPKAGVPVVYQVYVLEDSIAATVSTPYEQDNYSSAVQGGASPLNPWWHNYTLRDGLATAATGDPITTGAIAVNTKYTKSIKFKPAAGWMKNNLHLVAFVSYNGDSANKTILNAEEARNVGKTFWPTGINEITKNVELISAFPNPANLNDIVRIQYHTAHSTEVSMKVFNVVGQMVAQPYTSREVEGSHVINWRPSDDNLKAGIYLIEVSTQYGKEVQRISIH